MKKEKLMFKVLNTFAFIAMVAINAIAQILPLGGYNTGEISAMYPSLLTPASITFSIWGIIYLLLAAVLIQQFVSSKDEATIKIGWMFSITCGLNISWMVFWHYRMLVPATLVITGLWVFLMMISKKIGEESWLVKAAFRIYYGWITVAAAAQLYILLSEKYERLGEGTTAVIITVSAVIGLTVFGLIRALASRDSFFGMAMAWAIAGIFIKQIEAGFSNAYPGIVFVSAICVSVLIATIIYMWAHTRKLNEHTKIFPPETLKPAEETGVSG